MDAALWGMKRRGFFDGEDITDTIVAVVSTEPDWSRLPAGTPATLRRMLHRQTAASS